MPMTVLLSNDFFRVEQDPARKLVIVRRSSRSVASTDADAEFDRDSAIDQLIACVTKLRGQRLLMDVRKAPGNNNPVVEKRVQQFRRQLSELFPVSATLVATATGRLQLQRMARERGDPSGVFLDEEEAIASLLARPL